MALHRGIEKYILPQQLGHIKDYDQVRILRFYPIFKVPAAPLCHVIVRYAFFSRNSCNVQRSFSDFVIHMMRDSIQQSLVFDFILQMGGALENADNMTLGLENGFYNG